MKIKIALLLLLTALLSPAWGSNRIEILQSRVKDGVDYYRDGPFTISHLKKQKRSDELTLIRGFITNDSTRRAVSVQMEITCYNQAGDLLGTQLVEVNYLNSKETQPFEAKIRKDADQITLFEAAVQDFTWDE